ncbi:hypothetical protein PsorP6_009492 [Peronosclerospora sorghi]|uniref:Uncharacterized protein n=1 Tax=Peronosclerospora sorghi TaxID=230839 RepID=A0ACC0VZQ1_9STRA|nr:hypothetical protein PsorP6_009492 [Peronosclerospora sorghi]
MGCCCEWRAPKPLRYVLPCMIVGLIMYLYCSFVTCAQTLVLERGASFLELPLFHSLTFLLCWSLVQTLWSRDSFLAQRTLRSEEMKAIATEMETSRIETKMNGAVRTCRKCRVLKPDRTHHCNGPSLRLHQQVRAKKEMRTLHVTFNAVSTGNRCIGYFNYKFFVQFLGWSAATCLYQSSLLFRYVLAESLDRAGTLYMFGKLGFFNLHLQIVSVFFTSACVGIALGCFYLMHLYFVANNYSTLEYCEKRDDPDYINYYNVGLGYNFQEVFGTYWELPYWFVPLHSPSIRKRDGNYFPLNKHFIKIE